MAGLPTVRARWSHPAVTLRPATAADRDRVLHWNGAPDVRARSLDPRPISPEAHARWFAARLTSPYGHLWIVEDAGRPVGVVRVDRETPGGTGRISIALDGAVRGRGIGKAALALACTADGGPVAAEILTDNAASLACFAAAGFVAIAAPPGGDPRITHHLWRRRDDQR